VENIDRPQSPAPYPTAQKPKPFATQIADALIDGAAAIAKSILLGPFARITKSDQTAVAAMAVVSAEETGQERPRKAGDEKSVGAKKSAFATKAAKEKANARSAKKTIKRVSAKADKRRLASKAPRKARRKSILKKPR
jgi:hypothetical protein